MFRPDLPEVPGVLQNALEDRSILLLGLHFERNRPLTLDTLTELAHTEGCFSMGEDGGGGRGG